MRPTRESRIAIAFIGGVLLSTLFFPGSGFAYEEIAVSNGGTLIGKVTLRGTPPPARVFHLIFSPNIDFCGKISDGKGNRLLKEFRSSQDGAFQDVVVAVVGVERGRKFDYSPELSLENCRIGPFVMPIRNQSPIRIVNKDPIAHDIQAYTLKDEYTFEMFNKPMVPQESALRQVRLRKDHYLFRTQCGVHDFMQSWGFAVGNPYFAVTGPDGTFSIPDLPPGEYSVIAWHPYMKVQVRTLKVAPDQRVALDFQFNSSEVSIPLYGLQTGYRFDTAFIDHPLAPPGVELQLP